MPSSSSYTSRHLLLTVILLPTLLSVLFGCLGRRARDQEVVEVDPIEELDQATPETKLQSAGCDLPRDARYVPGQSVIQTTTIDGLTRSWILRLPQHYDHEKSYPAIMVLHGGFGSGAQIQENTRFDPLADREDVVMIYPDGIAQYPNMATDALKIRTWNAGGCCGHALESGVDDVNALQRMLDQVEAAACIDRSRIYLTGFSNGAMMTYRMACEAPERFAAMAPGGASVTLEECSPSRPTPLFHFHGLMDKNAPFEGGNGCGPGDTSALVPVPEVIDQWHAMFACTQGEELTLLETAEARCTSRTGCEDDVQLCVFPQGVHSWPGSAPRESPIRACRGGEHVSSFSATEAAWEFFARHSLEVTTP